LLALSGCETRFLPASDASGAVLLSEASQEGDVRAAIIRSLKAERFETESEDAGLIQARYRKGDRSIQIAVEYTAAQYRVRYLASEGFEQKKEGSEIMIEQSFHKQIAKLKKRIERDLVKPAPAAPSQDGGTVAPEPQVDTRSSGQVIVDILQAHGHTCVAQETRYLCTAPGDAWQYTVEYLIDPNTGANTIWYDSYSNRAFAKKCARFNNAISDLKNTEHSFSATCDDNTQTFRFNTALNYGPELEVIEWIKSHLERRAEAFRLLSSVGAIRK
jgi:hypothetical protein